MFSDIAALGFAVFGMISFLFFCVKRVLLWREDNINVTVEIYDADKSVFEKINNLRSVFDFCGLGKKCTVIVVNYGAPKWFCNELCEYFSYTDKVKVVSPGNPQECGN